MYLVSVLADLQKVLAAFNKDSALCLSDHVFKLNEALFNLPEEDEVDAKLAAEVIECAGKIRHAFNLKTYPGKDPSFIYDYLALLGTMQNQHFFETKQTETLITWIKEVVEVHLGGSGAARGKKAEKDVKGSHHGDQGKGKGKPGKGWQKEEEPATTKGGKGKGSGPKGKAKGSANDYDSEPEEQPKGKSKGKSKPKDNPYDEEHVKKGKAKSKGKGDHKVEYEIHSPSGNDWDSWWYQGWDDNSAKDSAKGKGKNKGKGKSGKGK